MRSRTFVAMLAVVAGNGALAQQKTTVPAFFTGGVSQITDSALGTDWERIRAKGSAVLAVVPDASFKTLTGLCAPASPNNCGPCAPTGSPASCAGATGLCAAKCQFNANHASGQMVLGYVPTNFACDSSVSVSSVEGLVDAWYAKFPSHIQGIFYDIGPTLSTCGTAGNRNGLAPLDETTVQEQYWGDVYNYEVGVYGPAKVMLNASQFKNEWVMSDPVADYAITFEKPYSDWVSNYFADQNSSQPASWWTSSSYAGKLAHVIYDSTQFNVSSAVTRSRTSTYASPVLYLYDGSSTAYNHLACFFEKEVAGLQNQSDVGGKTYCAASGQCKDLENDTSNCGTCGTTCTPNCSGCTVSCSAGSCVACSTSSATVCNGGCKELLNDAHACGTCDNDCTTSCPRAGCSLGACTFPSCTTAQQNICTHIGLQCDGCTNTCF